MIFNDKTNDLKDVFTANASHIVTKSTSLILLPCKLIDLIPGRE